MVGCCGGLVCAWLESILVCVVCVGIIILFMRFVIVWSVVRELVCPRSLRDESGSRPRGARGVLEQAPEKLSKKSPIRRFGIRRPAARNTEKIIAKPHEECVDSCGNTTYSHEFLVILSAGDFRAQARWFSQVYKNTAPVHKVRKHCTCA